MLEQNYKFYFTIFYLTLQPCNVQLKVEPDQH